MASSLPSGPTLGASSSRMEAPGTYISSVERHTQALWVYEGDQMVHRSVGRFASLALGRTPKVDTTEQEGTGARDDEGDGEFARGDHVKAWPSPEQFLKHPLAIFALVPKDAALFLAGAVGGAAAKTLTAPVDRIKLLMQTHSARIIGKSARA